MILVWGRGDLTCKTESICSKRYAAKHVISPTPYRLDFKDVQPPLHDMEMIVRMEASGKNNNWRATVLSDESSSVVGQRAQRGKGCNRCLAKILGR